MPQLKAPAAICMMLLVRTGDVLKKKIIVVLPFDKVKEFAGIPFTVKSLASTVPGSTASVTLITKEENGALTTPPQSWLVTEQPVGVIVGVGVAVGVAVAVAVGVAVAVAVGVGVASDWEGAWISTETGPPVLKKPMFAVLVAGPAEESNRKL